MKWLVSCALVLCAASADAATYVRAVVGDPELAWSGRSGCYPCNAFCGEFRRRNERLVSWGKNPWRIGYTETQPDGTPNHFVLAKALPGESVPYFVLVINGVETGQRIDGYDAADPTRDINAIRALHPNYKPCPPPMPPEPPVVPPAPEPPPVAPPVQQRYLPRTIPFGEQSRACPCPGCPGACPDCPCPQGTQPVVYGARPAYMVLPPVRVQTNAYNPHWTWPAYESLKSHLVRHGWSRAYLDTLSRDDLERLHDRCHDSGRSNPDGSQNWAPRLTQPARAIVPVLAAPVYAASPAVVVKTPTVRTQSRGGSVLGIPIWRGYRTSVTNPGSNFMLAAPVYRAGGQCPAGMPCPNR